MQVTIFIQEAHIDRVVIQIKYFSFCYINNTFSQKVNYIYNTNTKAKLKGSFLNQDKYLLVKEMQ